MEGRRARQKRSKVRKARGRKGEKEGTISPGRMFLCSSSSAEGL